MRVYGYLRASTKDQDAKRAKNELKAFAKKQGHKIDAWFLENESGATLKRPELFRLLDIAQINDVLLVEQVDRISRLNAEDWEKLKSIIGNKGIRIVALDLPTSHQFMQISDEFTQRMFSAINAMMLDMLAAVARKDYEDRRKRQRQGIARAKSENKYKGRPVNQQLRDNIAALIRDGKTWSDITNLLGCSRATIAKVRKTKNTGMTSQKKQISQAPQTKTTKVILWLQVENNSKFVRGKTKSRQYIEEFQLSEYGMRKLGKDSWEYELTFEYESDEDLEQQIEDLASEMQSEADSRNGFIDCHFTEVGSERSWL